MSAYRPTVGTDMSQNYPWLKLQKGTKRSPKIRKMSLEQQAVFYNLLQHAGLQEDEGSFDDTDREELALEVADERTDILAATVDYLLKVKILSRLDDGRLGFTNYDEHQATKKDAESHRQHSLYTRRKLLNVVEPRREVLKSVDGRENPALDRDREEDRDGEVRCPAHAREETATDPKPLTEKRNYYEATEKARDSVRNFDEACKRAMLEGNADAVEVFADACLNAPLVSDPLAEVKRCRLKYSFASMTGAQKAALLVRWLQNEHERIEQRQAQVQTTSTGQSTRATVAKEIEPGVLRHPDGRIEFTEKYYEIVEIEAARVDRTVRKANGELPSPRVDA